VRDAEPAWGDAPDSDVITELLLERYPLASGQRLAAQVDTTERTLAVELLAGRHRYRIEVAYLRAAEDRDPWLLLVDALDNLYGSLLESSFDHRSLPSGDDVEFESAVLRVHVEHTMPELDRIADQILGDDGVEG
jgi:hypothetical protein